MPVGIRKPLSAVLVTLCGLTVGLVAMATPAFAIKEYVPAGPAGSFGTPGSAPGQLKEPVGVAVNDSSLEPTAGDVYVADKGNNRGGEVRWAGKSGFALFLNPTSNNSDKRQKGSQ